MSTDSMDLDPDIVSVIRVSSLRMLLLNSMENEHIAWQQCVKAIDEYGRRIIRHTKVDKENFEVFV